MSEHRITIAGGTSKRLPTAGKYCDRDIVITAEGGAENLDTVLTEQGELIAELKEILSNKAAGGGGESENLLDEFLSGELTSIDSDVTSIRASACYGNTTLVSVRLPEATKIGGSCFRGCTGLTTFEAPKVTSLGTYAFYGCSKLTEVNFPYIPQAPSTCFYQCTALTRADFGVNCKTLSGSSLAYCSKLTTLILRYTAGVVSIATNTFSGFTFKGYVYVPKTLDDGSDGIEAYKAYTNWSGLSSVTFRAIEDYPEITGG